MGLYDELLIKYASTKFTKETYCDFHTFIEKLGYKYKTCDKVFNTFEECWSYMMEMAKLTRQNYGFEIVDCRGN